MLFLYNISNVGIKRREKKKNKCEYQIDEAKQRNVAYERLPTPPIIMGTSNTGSKCLGITFRKSQR